MQQKINIKNKKAYHDYEILEKLVAGIELMGTEIKSVRLGKASLTDTYCAFRDHELFVTGMHIAEYKQGSYYNHEPYRERKLLLTQSELKRWYKRVREKGLTITPLRLFLNDRGLAKLEIALVRGKKEYDKRETIKQKDLEREMGRLRKLG